MGGDAGAVEGAGSHRALGHSQELGFCAKRRGLWRVLRPVLIYVLDTTLDMHQG